MQTNEQVWAKIATGDQYAYTDAYRLYYKRFYNYGKKFTNNDPLLEDAIQETLLTIWDKRTVLESLEYPGTYFYTAFRRLLFQKINQEQKRTNSNVFDAEPEFGADHILISKEIDADLKKQLQNAIHQLSARQREAIFLRFYEGLSYDEVAVILGITTKATYKVMARALAQLKEQIALPGAVVFLLLKGG